MLAEALQSLLPPGQLGGDVLPASAAESPVGSAVLVDAIELGVELVVAVFVVGAALEGVSVLDALLGIDLCGCPDATQACKRSANLTPPEPLGPAPRQAIFVALITQAILPMRKLSSTAAT